MLLILGTPSGLNRRIVSPRSEKLLRAQRSCFSSGTVFTTPILTLPVRSCFFNVSTPDHSSETYESPLLPRKPEPPDLLYLEQRQQPPQLPDPPDPPDPPLVTSTATLVTAASSITLVIAAPLLSASGLNGPVVYLCSSAIPSSDGHHLRSASSPSSLTAATKLLRSVGADVSPRFFSVWAWPMNQVEAFSPSSKRPNVFNLANESPSLKLDFIRPFRCTADMMVPQALRVCLSTDSSCASLPLTPILAVPRWLCVIYVHSLLFLHGNAGISGGICLNSTLTTALEALVKLGPPLIGVKVTRPLPELTNVCLRDIAVCTSSSDSTPLPCHLGDSSFTEISRHFTVCRLDSVYRVHLAQSYMVHIAQNSDLFFEFAILIHQLSQATPAKKSTQSLLLRSEILESNLGE